MIDSKGWAVKMLYEGYEFKKRKSESKVGSDDEDREANEVDQEVPDANDLTDDLSFNNPASSIPKEQHNATPVEEKKASNPK